ncbi:hypothetical protein EBZ80_03630 [bacterium]|nr:hypothetical protein [bacterium]
MLLEEILYFPGGLDTVIDVLCYVMAAVCHDEPVPRRVRLEPSEAGERHTVWLGDEDGLWARLPAKWDVAFETEPSSGHATHALWDLLKDLLQACARRSEHVVLGEVLRDLLHEFPLDCAPCARLARQKALLKQELPDGGDVIDRFVTAPVEDEDEALGYLRIIQANCQKVLRQVRGERLREHFLETVWRVPDHAAYRDRLLHGRPVDALVHEFRKRVTSRTLKAIPFVEFRGVVFDEWLRSLVGLALCTSETDQEDDARAQVKKLARRAYLVLIVLFPEPAGAEEPGLVRVVDGRKERWVECPGLCSYHPLLRGTAVARLQNMYR